MSTSIPPKNISFSDIRNAAANAGIASDPDSGLGEGWPSISLNALRGKTLVDDSSTVPSGSNAISLKSVFRGKSFNTTQQFNALTTISGNTSSATISGIHIGQEYVFIFYKDGSVDEVADNATVTFNYGSGTDEIYEVINNGGLADQTEYGAIHNNSSFPTSLSFVYNPDQTASNFPWVLTSGTENQGASVWTSTCGTNPTGSANGVHYSYSYLKIRIGVRSGVQSTITNKPTSITITTASEAGFDQLKVWKKNAPRYGNRGIYRVTLTDSAPDGWNHGDGRDDFTNETDGVKSFISIDRTEGSTQGIVANAKQISGATSSAYNTYISKTGKRQVPFFITHTGTKSPFPLTHVQVGGGSAVINENAPAQPFFEDMTDISAAARLKTRVTIPHPDDANDENLAEVTTNVILGEGKHTVFILADDYTPEIGWYIELLPTVNDTNLTATKLYQHAATGSGWLSGEDFHGDDGTRNYRYFTTGAYSDSAPGTYSFQIN